MGKLNSFLFPPQGPWNIVLRSLPREIFFFLLFIQLFSRLKTLPRALFHTNRKAAAVPKSLVKPEALCPIRSLTMPTGALDGLCLPSPSLSPELRCQKLLFKSQDEGEGEVLALSPTSLLANMDKE